MAAPEIEIRTSLQVAQVGVAFSFQPAALNVPTSWAALYLPPGLSINGTTGAITGTPTTEGFWQTVLAATNDDGVDRIILLIPVAAADVVDPKDPFDLYLDFDSSSLLVTVPGQPAPEEGQPLFYAPMGTNRNLFVGVLVDADYVDCDPDEDGLTVRLGLKEKDTERLISLTTGDPEMVELSGGVIRYRQAFRINPADWAGVLLDYEDDNGTMVAALAEIQVTRGTAATLFSHTLTDAAIAIEGSIESGLTGDHDFLTVPEFVVATPMRLTLTLTVAGRVLQTVALVRTFDLVYEGGVYVISNLAGTTTGQGAVEGDHWRATLTMTGLTGDANSVDCDYSITTTDEVAPYYEWVFDFDGVGGFSGNFSSPGDTVIFFDTLSVSLFDGSDTPIGSATSLGASSFDDFADFIAAIETAWQTASGASDVYEITAESSTAVRIKVLSSTTVRGIDIAASSPTPTAADVVPGVAGDATTCSVVAVLEQLSDPSSVPLNLTSRKFRIGIPKDIVPDPT